MRNNGIFYCIVICLFFSIPLSTSAQEGGIQFQSGLSWKDIQAKAKAEGKLIFMDCYATWCGPCKWMAKNIFTQKEVGTYMNSNFVCVAVQLDKTANDSQDIKKWYNDAEAIQQEYKIEDYPTYLFFSADGKALHRIVGATVDGANFIGKAGEALDSVTQYYTKISRWQDYKVDTAFLYRIYTDAKQVGDDDQAKAIAEAYLDAQTNLFTKYNLLLMIQSGQLRSSKNKWFQFYVDNAIRIDDSLNGTDGIKHFVAWKLVRTIFSEEIQPLFSQRKPLYWRTAKEILQKKYGNLGENLEDLVKYLFGDQIGRDMTRLANNPGSLKVDWAQIAHIIRKNYPDYNSKEILLQRETRYFQQKGEWTACADAAYALINKFGNKIDDHDINNIVWYDVFEHSNNSKIWAEALKWMKYIVEIKGDTDMNYLDTYANLLYKMGNKNKALIMEDRAIQTAVKAHEYSDDIKTWQNNLEKMQQGEPTWINMPNAL